jgi:steroid 5-alpha reductase family enzyme
VSSATLRNVAIIAALAALVAFLPSGQNTADFVSAVLSILLTIMFVVFGAWFYRSYRTEIYSLGDRHRAILYGSLGVALFAMSGSRKLLDTGVGTIAFFAMLMGASLGLYTVWRHYREYGL